MKASMMRLFEVDARVDDGCNYYDEKHFIFADNCSEAHMLVKKNINSRDSETFGTIVKVKEIDMSDVHGKTIAVIKKMAV